MAQARKSLLPPRKVGNYRFSLTPLADAMFQLLIFFMLSSSLSPYSLLTIRAGDPNGGAIEDPNAAPDPNAVDQIPALAANAAIWSIEEGQIVIGGQAFPVDQIRDLTNALLASGSTEILLIVKPDAQVQDLTSVLESLGTAGITAIQLAQAAS